jgi:hypothetical protein
MRELVVVCAHAGSGKSTTLRLLTERHPRYKFSNWGGNCGSAEIKYHFDLANSFTAAQVRETLRQFLLSTDKEPGSRLRGSRLGRLEGGLNLKVTRAYWREMISPDSAVPLSHDGYLNFLSWKKRRLRYVDVILLDKAQDTNAITAQFVSMQRAEGATVHRAKGSEWDSVQVAEDFLKLCDADLEAENMTEPEFDEEVNLIYVDLQRTL